jgi:magnesium transporter
VGQYEYLKISAWAAILIVPTLIAGIYGMNFEYMPELHWWAATRSH